MIFIDNKYTSVYYRIVNQAVKRDHIKCRCDGYQTHHIIPRCVGGSNDPENLVVLTYKEHRVCHCLLIKMQLTKTDGIKMRHAYGFFNKSSRFNGPRYKSGKDNIFSTPEIIELVRTRMTTNNPMKNPIVARKSKLTRQINNKKRGYVQKRTLRDKFVTPFGIFKTKKEIQKNC